MRLRGGKGLIMAEDGAFDLERGGGDPFLKKIFQDLEVWIWTTSAQLQALSFGAKCLNTWLFGSFRCWGEETDYLDAFKFGFRPGFGLKWS